MGYRQRNKGGRRSIFWRVGAPLLSMLAMTALILDYVFVAVMGKIYHILLTWLNKHYHYYAWLKRDLADCESILELGCGSKSPILHLGYGKKTDAIDIWEPYIEGHNKANDYHKSWLCDVLEFDFPEKAYDAVVMFDVLEHLPDNSIKAIDLFGKIERCARKKVIIFCPNGYIPNDEVDSNPYQAHLSAWRPVDFIKHGYKVYGGTGFKPFFGKSSLPKHPQWLFYLLGMLSQPLVYHFPKLAFHSYAVKELKETESEEVF